uniref:Ig-like domain-containing protein n=1 Tax=Knipowitschia caucasica TaxID=637954 RepID=A0AAV2KNY4_KNICA
METRPHGSVLLLICLTIGGPFTRAGQVIQVKEGQDLQFNCYFQEDSFVRIFCKNHCEESGEHLIRTYSFEDWASEGRYRLEWEKESSSHYVMRVFIQNMQKSDTGSYSCLLYDWTMDMTVPVPTIRDVEIYVISADSSGSDAVISKPSSESKQGSKGEQYSVREGGSVLVQCVFNTSGTRRMFCRPDQVTDNRRDQQTENRRDQQTENRRDQVRENRRDQVTENRRDQVTENRRDQVTENRRDQVTENRRDQVRENRRDQVTENRRDQVTESRRDQVTENRRDQVTENRRDQVTENRRDQVTENRRDQVTENRRDHVAENRRDHVAEGSCGHVLVETGSYHKNGDRYSLKYKKGSKSSYFLDVTIKDVRSGDSGRYLCVLEKAGRQESVPVYIQVLLAEASTDSGLTSPKAPHQNQTPLLYVTSSVLCSRRRIGRSTDTAEAADPEVSECRVYEEIPCDSGQSTAPPAASAESSTYSLCSAPSAAPQTEVMCATVSYSEVDLSSCNSAPRCPPEDHVLYSTARDQESVRRVLRNRKRESASVSDLPHETKTHNRLDTDWTQTGHRLDTDWTQTGHRLDTDMRVQAVTLLLLLLVLSCGPCTRAAKVIEAGEGEDLEFKCSFYASGRWKMFCRNRCELVEDYLVLSHVDVEQNGRFKIEFQKRLTFPNTLYVSIRDVRRSDAGSYSCGLAKWEDRSVIESHLQDVIIYVTSGSSEDTRAVPISSASQKSHSTSSGVGLSVGVTVGVLLVLTLILTLLYWKRRTSTATGPLQSPGPSHILQVADGSSFPLK